MPDAPVNFEAMSRKKCFRIPARWKDIVCEKNVGCAEMTVHYCTYILKDQ